MSFYEYLDNPIVFILLFALEWTLKIFFFFSYISLKISFNLKKFYINYTSFFPIIYIRSFNFASTIYIHS